MSSSRTRNESCQHAIPPVFMTSFAHTWALDIADNASGSVVHEFNAHLGDTSTRAYDGQVSLPLANADCRSRE